MKIFVIIISELYPHCRVLIRELIIYELKPAVCPSLADIKECHLAQCIVQGYYTLIQRNLQQIIIALTNISTTHYFMLTFTLDNGLKVEWHHRVTITYPPEEQADVELFISTAVDLVKEML